MDRQSIQSLQGSHKHDLFLPKPGGEVEYNPVDKIEKKLIVKAPRNVLSKEQRILIDQHFLRKAPEFHRYVQIFFHCGARRAELLRLKGSNVDLSGQKYRVLVKKERTGIGSGKQSRM